MCPFEKRHGTFKTLQMKVFGSKKFQKGIKSAKLEIAKKATLTKFSNNPSTNMVHTIYFRQVCHSENDSPVF